jgi:hypothetical protein
MDGMNIRDGPTIVSPVKRRIATPAEIPKELDIVRFARERLEFDPDAMQEKVLRTESKRVLLNCTRQWGKSKIAAVKAVYRAYSVPKSLCLVASPAKRQSSFVVQYVEEFIGLLGIKRRGDGKNPLSVQLPNGSRIVGLPGKAETLRGFSRISMLMIDEAAQVPDRLYKTMRPMLATSGGDIWLMSTPARRRGFFYDEWVSPPGDWHRISVKATECPRIPKSFLEEERRKLGPMWFRQEYMCEFLDETVSLFPREVIERSLTDEIQPLWEEEEE